MAHQSQQRLVGFHADAVVYARSACRPSQFEFALIVLVDLNNVDVYVDITIADMLNMAYTMQNQTTKALITESTLIAKLETLTVEELKTFDAYKEFENLWNK